METNEATIEGLLDQSDIDADGFMKITAGITSKSGWYIRIHVDSIVASSEPPATNPDYPDLGPLQFITVKRDGQFKSRGNNTSLPLTEFFANVKAAKADTVSPTGSYKNLMD